MASDKEIAKPEEYSDSEDEAEETGERRHANSHKDEPTAKRAKVSEKTGDEEDIKTKTEDKVKSSSGASSTTNSPKPSSPKVSEAKSPEKLSNTEQTNDATADKYVLFCC